MIAMNLRHIHVSPLHRRHTTTDTSADLVVRGGLHQMPNILPCATPVNFSGNDERPV